jgi:hypothetical protein
VSDAFIFLKLEELVVLWGIFLYILNMRQVPVFIHRIPELVHWFFDFTEIDPCKLEKNHPILNHFEEYEKWWKETFQKKPEDFDSISAGITDFAGFIKGVQIFQRQIEGKIKSEFVSDLLNNCYSIFFEIKVLMHFYIFGYENIIYRDNNVDGKHPDIMFTDKNLRRIFVECTRKYAKPERCTDDALLIEDLMRSVKLKAEEYKNLNVPFVYAVHVPEEIEFDRDKFRTDLGNKLHEIFKDEIFRNVNWVVFSSYKLPEVKFINIKGDVMFETDLPHLRYNNAFVAPELHVDIVWELK